MRVSICMVCGIVATCACASNKPAEDAHQQTTVEQPSAEPPATVTASQPERVREAPPSNYQATPSVPPMGGGPASEPAGAPPPPPAAAPPQDSTAANTPDKGAPAQPDNTKVNKRDRGGDTPTPMDQGNGASDLHITQQIRQAIMSDGSLSFTAKNVKIITTHGKVTLRGPVHNAQERSAIEASAQRIAGQNNVDNQIEVKQ